MAKMKVAYYVGVCEAEFFFDSKGKLLQYWSENDASFRYEYMNPLFKALGIDMQCVEPNDPRFRDAIKKVLTEEWSYPEDEVEEMLA